MQSYTYEVGSLRRKEFKIRLDELGLPYSEHSSSFFASTIVVKASTKEHEAAADRLMLEVEELQQRMIEAKNRRAAEEQEKIRMEKAIELARKNRFRRLTFRKPLKSN